MSPVFHCFRANTGESLPAGSGLPLTSARKLRVLHLTVSDKGGAGVACLRLHRALKELDIESRVVVRRRAGDDSEVIEAESRLGAATRFRLDRLPLRLYPGRNIFAWWSVNRLHRRPEFALRDWEPDIVHAHWIGDGFLPLEYFAEVNKPVVWTMHDMWPFTGGCHYTRDCELYEAGCGTCPQLGSRQRRDLSFRCASRKERTWSQVHGVAVATSLWLAETARRSAVMRYTQIEMIPNGLDGNIFKPGSRSDARRRLGLRDEDRILLAGAVGAVREERKGFSFLTEALSICRSAGRTENWRLLVFGATAGPGEEVIGIPVSYRGNINTEDELTCLYQAADVYVLPSLQDNLPNTVVEAFACAKPVIGFRAAGLASMITHGTTGWLADPFSPTSLAAEIRNALGASAAENCTRACREEFERTYAWPGPAKKYSSLYRRLLGL